jgi:hypothetical protein
MMNAKNLFIGLLHPASASLASVQLVAINGVDRDGGNYW